MTFSKKLKLHFASPNPKFALCSSAIWFLSSPDLEKRPKQKSKEQQIILTHDCNYLLPAMVRTTTCTDRLMTNVLSSFPLSPLFSKSMEPATPNNPVNMVNFHSSVVKFPIFKSLLLDSSSHQPSLLISRIQ